LKEKGGAGAPAIIRRDYSGLIKKFILDDKS